MIDLLKRFCDTSSMIMRLLMILMILMGRRSRCRMIQLLKRSCLAMRHKMIQKQIPTATGRCRGSRSSISGPKPGGERDLVNFWEHVYKKNGWNRFAKYDKRGGLNLPYLLFKHKNVVDPEVRKKKWMSARPIAPGTKHPMRKLFHLAGRAWSFIETELGEDNFIIPHGGKVTKFLEEVQ